MPQVQSDCQNLDPPHPDHFMLVAVVTTRRRRRRRATMEEIDMRLIIILTVIIYWLLPVDIAPGPLDDIIVTLAGVIMAAADGKEVKA